MLCCFDSLGTWELSQSTALKTWVNCRPVTGWSADGFADEFADGFADEFTDGLPTGLSTGLPMGFQRVCRWVADGCRWVADGCRWVADGFCR